MAVFFCCSAASTVYRIYIFIIWYILILSNQMLAGIKLSHSDNMLLSFYVISHSQQAIKAVVCYFWTFYLDGGCASRLEPLPLPSHPSSLAFRQHGPDNNCHDTCNLLFFHQRSHWGWPKHSELNGKGMDMIYSSDRKCSLRWIRSAKIDEGSASSQRMSFAPSLT
jgi:hypothetical protein